MNWIKNIWSQVWKTGNNDFASGAYSELATPKLLSSAKRKVVIEDLICEIEERNLPPTDKAMELFLKSYEIWNIGGVENIEIAMKLSYRGEELLLLSTREGDNMTDIPKTDLRASASMIAMVEPPSFYNKDEKDLWTGLCACIVPFEERKDVTFDSIIGHEEVKNLLQSTLVASFQRDSRCRESNSASNRGGSGIVFVGPPGTGKTSLAYASCNCIPNATLLSVNSSFLSSKYHGDSTKLCRMLFTLAKTCRPAMIFFDEMEDLCGKRNEKEDGHTSAMKGVLLAEMQRLKSQKQVYLLGATNRVDAMDAGFVRRFEYFIYVGYASQEELFKLLKKENSLYLSSVTEAELKCIVTKLTGAPQSFVTTLVRKCADRAEHKLIHGKAFFRPTSSLEVMPCPKGFPGSLNVSMSQVPNNLRMAPPIIYEDYINCLESVGADYKDSMYDSQRYIDWKNNLGTAGLICELFPEASD